MDNNNVMTEEQKRLMIELYKSYHTARETASIMDVSYDKVSAIFRGFNVAGIKKYNRINLIEEKTILNSLGI